MKTEMFTEIVVYMHLPRDERRAHLNLNEPCIEIGGHSTYFKGLLAHHLKTTIPWKHQIMVCHACNNAGCSNPNHLYWGSYHDNHIDSVECGSFGNLYERAVNKHGRDIFAKNAIKAGKTRRDNGLYDRLSLTDDELAKYRECIEKYDVTKFGWIGKFANDIGVSHTQIKRMCNKYFPNTKFYVRNSTNKKQ